MNWEDRISIDPAVLVGKPVIKGTRLSVELVVGLLADGWSQLDIVQQYHGLTIDDIHACLAYVEWRDGGWAA